MHHAITSYIRQHNMLPPQTTVIVGLSGGPDSIFLLHYLVVHRKLFDVHILAAHLNHGWRTNAQEDVDFCKNIAATFDVPFVHEHASSFGHLRNQGSTEEYGRRLRQTFFEQIATTHYNHRIALAHHMDDQKETFFIRLLRGASLTGLTGIRPVQGNYVRPLLETNKSDIIEYLHKQGIPYLIDPTNQHDRYLRNRIRNHLLPVAEECDARFPRTMINTMRHLSETEAYLAQQTADLFARISTMTNGVVQISLTSFKEINPFMQKRIIMYWLCTADVYFIPSQGLVHEIIRFLMSRRGGNHIFYQQWSITKHRQHATIQKI